MAKTPKPEDLRLAAAWLEVYEGSGDDGRSMDVVRNWLLEQADSAEFRATCKEVGVSVTAARKAINPR